MGSIAEAPKPNATKKVQVGIQTELVATIARSITKGTTARATHSLWFRQLSACPYGVAYVCDDLPFFNIRILLYDAAGKGKCQLGDERVYAGRQVPFVGHHVLQAVFAVTCEILPVLPELPNLRPKEQCSPYVGRDVRGVPLHVDMRLVNGLEYGASAPRTMNISQVNCAPA